MIPLLQTTVLIHHVLQGVLEEGGDVIARAEAQADFR